MIRSEHAIIRYDFSRWIAHPDRLTRLTHAHYVGPITQCIETYRGGRGEPRQSLHVAVAKILQQCPDCPPRRIAAMCKLLDDASQYAPAGDAFARRRRIFTAAAAMHPLVERCEGIFDHQVDQAKSVIADQCGRPWSEIESDLFADVIECQRLDQLETPNLTAAELLAQYNVAQTQAALYRCVEMRIDAGTDWSRIAKATKLSRLMHHIERLPCDRGYRFHVNGPASVLRQTQRYGVAMAKLLSTLLSCRDWRAQAVIRGPKRHLFRMRLSDRDGLRGTVLPAPEFDSALEARVDRYWQRHPVDGWAMTRHSDLLFQNQTVYTPDFMLRRCDDDTRIFIEVVGFWTPEYLADKAERLAKFVGDQNKFLLIFDRPTTPAHQPINDLKIPTHILHAKTRPADWIRTALDIES